MERLRFLSGVVSCIHPETISILYTVLTANNCKNIGCKKKCLTFVDKNTVIYIYKFFLHKRTKK